MMMRPSHPIQTTPLRAPKKGDDRRLNRFFRFLSIGGLMASLVCVSVPTWGKAGSSSIAPASINRALPGSQLGVLTKAVGATLHINQHTYTLAPLALIEDKYGATLSIHDIQANDVEYNVQYWLGSDRVSNQIIQLIVTLPE